MKKTIGSILSVTLVGMIGSSLIIPRATNAQSNEVEFDIVQETPVTRMTTEYTGNTYEIKGLELYENNTPTEIARDTALDEKIIKLNQLKQLEEKKKAEIEKNKAKMKQAVASQGIKQLADNITDYDGYVEKWSKVYKLDPNIVRAVIMQESGGNAKEANGSGWGLMQIEKTLLKEFAQFGREVFGKSFTSYDRLNPEYNIAFGCSRLRHNLNHYNGDYEKALQAYNFSHYSLDLLIKQHPTNWKSQRKNIAKYNGHYKRTGSMRYGDPNYIENVMRYYQG